MLSTGDQGGGELLAASALCRRLKDSQGNISSCKGGYSVPEMCCLWAETCLLVSGLNWCFASFGECPNVSVLWDVVNKSAGILVKTFMIFSAFSSAC